MRLAFLDTASDIPGVTIDNPVWHYRFGTRQSLTSETGGLDAQILNGSEASIQLVDFGLDYTEGSDVARVNPQSGSGSHLIYEQTAGSSSGLVDSFVFSTWVDYEPQDGPRILWGGHYHDDPDVVDPDQIAVRTCYMGFTQAQHQQLSAHVAVQSPGGYASMLTAHADVADVASGWRHVMFHGFLKRSDQARLYARWFVDGRFKGESSFRIDDETEDWRGGSNDGPVRLSFHDTLSPSLFAMTRSAPPWPGPSGIWGDIEAVEPFAGSMDEVLFAHDHPLLDGGGQPIISHVWNLNDQIFDVTRHPDPVVHGLASDLFVIRGPVEDTEIGPGASIRRIRIHFDRPVTPTGQGIWFSVRASDTAFEADDETPAWGSWFEAPGDAIYQDNWITVNPEGFFGNYVQVRLRVLPSADTLNLHSPEITSVEYETEYTATQGDHLDLPCSIKIGDYLDLPSRIGVQQSGSLDLPASIGVQYTGTPLGLPAAIQVPWRLDLPASIFAKPDYEWFDLPCRIQTSITAEDWRDLPAAITIAGSGSDIGHWDLPSSLFVPRRFDLPASIEVMVFMLPCRILVQSPPQHLPLPSSLDLVPDRPGAVNPITANIEPGSWNTQSQVSLAWQIPSYASAYPVTGYKWYLIDEDEWLAQGTFAEPPDQDPTYITAPPLPGTTLTSVTIDMTSAYYGSGRWVFVCYAVNTIGVAGSPSWFTIWFNRPPSRPQGVMTVNGADTLGQKPLVRFTPPTTFAWGVAVDPDGEPVSYEGQVATRPDFGPDQNGNSSIIASFSSNTNNYIHENSLKSGSCWWRIRAWDGKQYSEWGETAAFLVNYPPNRPDNLAVRKIDT